MCWLCSVPDNAQLRVYYAQTSVLTHRCEAWASCWRTRFSAIETIDSELENSLVTSIFLYACESWTLTAELQRRIQAMEMRCYRNILHISYKDHVTNEEVRAKIQQAIGPHEDLLTIVKRHKLQWYGHVSVHQIWPKPSFKALWKGEEDEADGGRVGKTTSGNGQAWSSVSPRGQ